MNYLLSIDFDTGAPEGIAAVKLTTAILNALARGAANVPALEGLTGTATLMPPPGSYDEISRINFSIPVSDIHQTVN